MTKPANWPAFRPVASVCITLMVAVLLGSSVAAETLSLDRQREIIQNYMIVTGQMPPSAAQSVGGEEPCESCGSERGKCGTQAILDFNQNYGRLDKGLMSRMGVQLYERPHMSDSCDTPGGWVRLHFTKTGDSACWRANVDTDGDGTPDYIETLAIAADSVMNELVNNLGFPRPLVDTGMPDGGDSRIDVYVVPLTEGLYGQTIGPHDSLQPQSIPSFVEIENDFQELPEYVGRPLGAALVTLAHELFHTIHFTIDQFEDKAWREMSGVWDEEHMFDDVNDYYLYGPLFFDFPLRSLTSTTYFHEYGAVLYPLYLTQTYGDSIMVDIWERCGRVPGYSFLPDADSSIRAFSIAQAPDSENVDTANFYTSMSQFAIWNYFTGPYGDQAPPGIGYEERSNYDYFKLDDFAVIRSYPAVVGRNENPIRPEYNGVYYIRLENLDAIKQHRRLSWYFGTDNISGLWGLSAIFQMKDNPDSFVVASAQWGSEFKQFVDTLVGQEVDTLGNPIIDVSKYRSITLAFIPATIASGATGTVGIGFGLQDTSVVDPALVNKPAAVLSPYPNPAVASEMDGDGVKFRFRMATDSTTYPVSSSAHLVVDLYTIAGERIRTLDGTYVGEDREGEHRTGLYEVAWDMRNEGGKDVASGVYLAYARLYSAASQGILMAEDRVKVAVIR